MPEALIVPHPLVEDAKVLIEADVLENLLKFRQLAPSSHEAGGILMGFRRGSHVHVAAISSPQPGDQQHRFGFHRQARAHQRIAVRHWNAQQQTMDYLGEWHTHPEIRPSPSSIDTHEWRRLCAGKSVPMIFLIVGTENALWLGVGQRSTLSGANAFVR
ncbi:Mov34/MPN/PAD-1 family protein [Cupriavidus sp. 2MCAB6]|uniref:Mov34/MPN/PAD-1 family protein n=1 Tax=Cupriavidus sp. 2MCAB6 TaxID=3232981 RepID=UPI003F93CADE